MSFRFLVSLFSLVITLSPVFAVSEITSPGSRTGLENKYAADTNWLDQLVLHVLDPNQAKAYFRGADPATILLNNGQTLAEFLEKKLNPPGSVFIPLPVPCPLFTATDVPTTDESLGLLARGNDLSAQGGSAIGCSIPEDAVAILTQIKILALGESSVDISTWPMENPELYGSMRIRKTPLQGYQEFSVPVFDAPAPVPKKLLLLPSVE